MTNVGCIYKICCQKWLTSLWSPETSKTGFQASYEPEVNSDTRPCTCAQPLGDTAHVHLCAPVCTLAAACLLPSAPVPVTAFPRVVAVLPGRPLHVCMHVQLARTS
ncbi:hypothetical protein CRG98_022327 [Punica granatum]|uniref:Uncharacterized protein n=1 Tax=Punica granatum TaxID=22663 RepID=A0A2I0JLZ2_PUNGR|nr:hypothetical protein CRG98_022327 [Punica granatum]